MQKVNLKNLRTNQQAHLSVSSPFSYQPTMRPYTYIKSIKKINMPISTNQNV